MPLPYRCYCLVTFTLFVFCFSTSLHARQPLATALQDIATQHNLSIVFDTENLRGKTALPISGNLPPREALNTLLASSGLQAREIEPGRFSIVQAPGAVKLPEITITAGNEYPDSPYNQSYTRSNATTATKTNTPIMETPVSVQVVPRAVMDDQQVISVADALRNVSGVQLGSYTFYDGFNIRGFDNGQSTYRNGIRQSFITNLETANLDRIEVLKGPAAILFGRIEPGGLVNLVTKRPLDTPYYSVQQQFGSYDLYRTTVDATGPILGNRSLLYRINLAYKDNNSFRDFVSVKHFFIAPSLTWRPNHRFEANIDFEYQKDTWVEDGSDGGIPAIGRRPASIPISRYLGDAHYNRAFPNKQDRILVGLDWTYRFNENWQLKNRFQYLNTDYYQRILWVEGLQPDNATLDRNIWHTQFDRVSYGTNLDLTGQFKTGLLYHKVLAGFDLYRYNSSPLPGAAYFGTSPGAPAIPSINIFNPQYNFDYRTFLSTAQEPNTGKEFNHWYGVYFQDQITLWDKLHILGGGRYDWTHYGNNWNDPTGFEKDRAGYFSPRVGILYQPLQWLSVYGNFVNSLGLNNSGRSASGPLPPETATQFEAGIKTAFFDQRLISTFSFFHITKQNVAAVDPNNPLFSKAIGEARSQGFEMDITGQITNNINIIATYAYIDAEITKDLGTADNDSDQSVGINSGNSGNRLASVPRHSGSIWANYNFTDENLRGLRIGTGVFVRGLREGDNANTFQLPGYARWDASIGYEFRYNGFRITPQFNVYNILDKEYFDNSSFRGNIRPGIPFTVLGSIRLEY
ncbi:MAG: TonB-dependent receptor [Nitrosomonas sp.]|nr:TonB-dependent receptor [Nitrosomonas sp.]